MDAAQTPHLEDHRPRMPLKTSLQGEKMASPESRIDGLTGEAEPPARKALPKRKRACPPWEQARTLLFRAALRSPPLAHSSRAGPPSSGPEAALTTVNPSRESTAPPRLPTRTS